MLHIRGKGDKPRLVPIVGESLHQALIVACEGKQRADILFVSRKNEKGEPQPYKNIKKAIKSAAARAGINKPVYNHLLRHSAATNAVIAGVNIRALQTILGHSDIRTTEMYTHMAAETISTEGLKMAGLHNTAKIAPPLKPLNTSKTSKTKTLKNPQGLRLVKS
jgi:site-specific recombinase XerD